MYRPNYCCECGSEVERASWRPWTSRRFCPECYKRFRKSHFLARAAGGTALFCAGILAGRAGRSAPPPLLLERGQLHAEVAPSVKPAAAEEELVEGKTTAAPLKSEPSYGPDGTADERPTDPSEVVYICGARTQKGTPCRRRVRGPGRCWQHRGMPAMLPPNKLVVPGE